MAEENGVPEKNIGVRVDYTEYPFKIGVFDYQMYLLNVATFALKLQRGLFPPDSELPYHPMVANEALRRSQEGHRCVMLIVIHSDGRELPSLAYIEDEPSSHEISPDTHTSDSHYEDEMGNNLYPRKGDTLGKALELSRALLQRDAESFWKNGEFYAIVEHVQNVCCQPAQ